MLEQSSPFFGTNCGSSLFVRTLVSKCRLDIAFTTSNGFVLWDGLLLVGPRPIALMLDLVMNYQLLLSLYDIQHMKRFCRASYCWISTQTSCFKLRFISVHSQCSLIGWMSFVSVLCDFDIRLLRDHVIVTCRSSPCFIVKLYILPVSENSLTKLFSILI